MTSDPKNPTISADVPTTEQVGQGRYVIVGSLGAGSQGETLEAVDKQQGRPVAIKRFTVRSAKSWKDVELAEREATVLASLNHASLPRYIEHFEENGALYLVMEKVEGESLAARRRRKAPFTREQVLRFLHDAAVSLAYLHGQAPPIVHRDIKPGNVILRPDGSYCLVDFGSVRDSLKPEGGSTVVGTFGYMAPEQFQGRAAPVSDVYAVGATALSMLSGREPEDLPHKGLGIDVEAALQGQADRRLILALRSMLAPDPDQRAPSVMAALQIGGVDVDFEPPPGTRAGTAAAAKQARRARIEAEAARERYGAATAKHSAHEHRHDREARRRAEERAARDAEKEARRNRRTARREERREERHERRAQRRAHWHRPGRPVPPGIVLGIVLLFALQIASIATFALFQVLLPTLFTFIAIPGRRQRMLAIGRAGELGLTNARRHIRYQFLGGPEPTPALTAEDMPLSGQPPPPSRQRVSIDELDDDLEAEDHEPSLETPPRTSRE